MVRGAPDVVPDTSDEEEPEGHLRQQEQGALLVEDYCSEDSSPRANMRPKAKSPFLSPLGRKPRAQLVREAPPVMMINAFQLVPDAEEPAEEPAGEPQDPQRETAAGAHADVASRHLNAEGLASGSRSRHSPFPARVAGEAGTQPAASHAAAKGIEAAAADRQASVQQHPSSPCHGQPTSPSQPSGDQSAGMTLDRHHSPRPSPGVRAEQVQPPAARVPVLPTDTADASRGPSRSHVARGPLDPSSNAAHASPQLAATPSGLGPSSSPALGQQQQQQQQHGALAMTAAPLPDGVGVGTLVPYQAEEGMMSPPPQVRQMARMTSPSPQQPSPALPGPVYDPVLAAERARLAVQVIGCLLHPAAIVPFLTLFPLLSSCRHHHSQR